MSYISKYFLLGITSALFVTTSTKNIYAMKRSSEEHPFAIRAKCQCNQGLSSELVDIFAAQAKVISHDDLQCDQQKRLKELQQKIQYVKRLVGEESFAEDVLITSNYFIYKIKAYCFFDNLTMPCNFPNPFPPRFLGEKEIDEFKIMRDIRNRECCAFINLNDLDNEIKKIITIPGELFYDTYAFIRNLLIDKDIEEQKRTCVKLKEAGIVWLSTIYKIHLHINPKYLNDFTVKFADFIYENRDFLKIKTFKILQDWDKAQDGLPFVVVYLPTGYYPNKSDRYIFLDKYITWIQRFFDEWLPELALKYSEVKKLEDLAAHVVNRLREKDEIYPRYSYKINDVIFLAGGDGDSKEKWHSDYFFAKDCNDRIVYTDDFCFVKGFDYRLADVR